MFTHRMHILIYTGAHLYIYLYENVHTHRDMPDKKLCRTWRMQVSAHTHASLRMCAFFRVRAVGCPVSNPKEYRCVYVYQRTRAARAARAHTRRTAACVCEGVLAGTGDDEVRHADYIIEILARSASRRMAEWHQAGYEIQDFACAPCASSQEPSPPPDQRTGIRATPVDSRWSGLRGGRQATVGNGGRGSRQPCLLPARRGAFTRAFMTRGSDSPSGRGAPQAHCTCRAGVYAGL